MKKAVWLIVVGAMMTTGFALAQNGAGNSSDTEWWQWVLVIVAVPVLVALGVAASGIVLIWDILKAGVGFLKELKDKLSDFIDNWPSTEPPVFYKGLIVYQKRLFVDKLRVAPGESIFISWSFAMRNTENLTVRIKSVILVDGVEVKKQEETVSASARGFAIGHSMSFPAPGFKQVIGLVTVEEVGGSGRAANAETKMVTVVPAEELEEPGQGGEAESNH